MTINKRKKIKMTEVRASVCLLQATAVLPFLGALRSCSLTPEIVVKVVVEAILVSTPTGAVVCFSLAVQVAKPFLSL